MLQGESEKTKESVGPPGCPNYALISLRFYELLKSALPALIAL